MRIDRSYQPLLRLFRDNWSGSLLPRALILRELELAGTPMPVRTLDVALAKAVQNGELRRVESHDGGALYCLEGYARDHPEVIEEAGREPMRSLNAKNPELAKANLEHWKETHSVRPSTRSRVDDFVESLPVAARRRIRSPDSALAYPVDYRDAYTCRKCGARFLSVKARRNHEKRGL